MKISPIWCVPLAAAAAILLTTPARGSEKEPYLSVRTGLKCSQCHVNRTGGGGRTDFGNLYAQTRLPMRTEVFRDRDISEFIALSANFRALASGTLSGATPRTSFDLKEANLQAEVRLLPDVLAIYVDESLGPNRADAREAFLLLESLPWEGYVKAGKFVLPYGLRLVDDGEFIRERSGFNFATPDVGVELGVEPGPLSLFVSVTNGTVGAGENNDSKQVTGTASVVGRRARLGASFSRNDAPGGLREVVGGFGGFNVGRLTFLGEVDVIRDTPEGEPAVEQLAAFVEGDLLLRRGLNAKITYGFLDPDADVGENARIRMRFGLEAFPIQFFQVSAFYTLLDDIPQSTTDLDRLGLELHLYF